MKLSLMLLLIVVVAGTSASLVRKSERTSFHACDGSVFNDL